MAGFDVSLYRGRRVFVTGHTGFKGAWLCRMLTLAGASVTGYALEPPTRPSLFALADIGRDMHSVIGDIRDFAALKAAFDAAQPEIVLHLAAQSIVCEGYARPRQTYETNVMGTVNMLECMRTGGHVRSFLNVTTDKVYRAQARALREDDALGGEGPYASAKSCAELVTGAYRDSYFADGRVAISTARSGNAIGGGDFAPGRIVPDCVRAAMRHEPVIVRNPRSVRPYQHVLEPICAYLMIAMRQAQDGALAGHYNVGPAEADCVQTGALAELFVRAWGEDAAWRPAQDAPREDVLTLDCAALREKLGWRPRWDIATAMDKVVQWSRCHLAGGDVRACMDAQIASFLG